MKMDFSFKKLIKIRVSVLTSHKIMNNNKEFIFSEFYFCLEKYIKSFTSILRAISHYINRTTLYLE